MKYSAGMRKIALIAHASMPWRAAKPKSLANWAGSSLKRVRSWGMENLMSGTPLSIWPRRMYTRMSASWSG